MAEENASRSVSGSGSEASSNPSPPAGDTHKARAYQNRKSRKFLMISAIVVVVVVVGFFLWRYLSSYE